MDHPERERSYDISIILGLPQVVVFAEKSFFMILLLGDEGFNYALGFRFDSTDEGESYTEALWPGSRDWLPLEGYTLPWDAPYVLPTGGGRYGLPAIGSGPLPWGNEVGRGYEAYSKDLPELKEYL
jgi:hypothetical protein